MPSSSASRTLRFALVLAAALLALPATAAAHTVSDPTPFHLAPGDYFTVTVTGGTFASVSDVQIRLTPLGGSPLPDFAPQDVVANTSVGIRLPASLAVGEHDVNVLIGGTPSSSPDAHIWVRELPFVMVAKAPDYLPNQPGSAHHKDSDWGDVDGDGFLDIFQSISTGSMTDGNLDRLLISQLDVTPPPPSDFSNATGSINAVAGITNNRTYDADLVDIDLDGDLDLVRIDRGSSAVTKVQVRVLVNDGSGGFSDRTLAGPAVLPPMADINAVASNVAEVDSGDVDGDGRPDLLLCSWSGGAQNALLLNRLHSSGDFVLANDNPCNPAAPSAHALCAVRGKTNRGCAFGNFNNDSQLDILLPSMEGTEPDIVLLNTGNVAGVPQFSVESNWVKAPDGTSPQAGRVGGDLKVADLDGDGDDDAVIASPWTNQGRILWNDGGTKLVQLDASRYVIPTGSYDGHFADLDRDGDLDVLFGPYGGGLNAAVLINKGGVDDGMLFEAVDPPTFWLRESAGGPIAFTPTFELSMSPGDYNLDGDLDLLTGGFGETRVFQNTLFDPGGLERDWVFAIDRTRSMISGGKDFFLPAKNVTKAFLEQRHGTDLVGLVTFDYAGAFPMNPAAPDDATKAQVEFNVGAITPAAMKTHVEGLLIGTCSGRCTAIGWALKVAKDVAAGAPDPNREKVLVLATDGRQNQEPHPDTIIPTLPSHHRLYIVALGTDTDDRMLSALATNGGKFFFAGRSSDYESMQSDLREIDDDIEAHSTGKQVLQPLIAVIWAKPYTSVLRKMPVVAFDEPRFVERLLGEDPPTETDYFIVDPADTQLRFTLSWRGRSDSNSIVLTDPAGRSWPDPTNALSRERRNDKAHVVEVLDPLSGVWTVRRSVGLETAPSKLTAMAWSSLRLEAEADFPLFYTGEPLTLTARLTQGVPIGGAEARIRLASEEIATVAGQVQGPEVRFSSPALGEPGTYGVELVVFGPPNRPYTRSWRAAVHVAEPTPDEPDLRTAEIELDRSALPADGASTATATLRLRRRSGDPLAGAQVSFVAQGGSLTGAVQDHGDGSYSQTLVAGTEAGEGWVHGRVALTRLPARADFRLAAGEIDAAASQLTIVIGSGALCTNQQARYLARVTPVDGFGNGLVGAAVEITANREVDWDGPVQAVGTGEVYERAFWGPESAGAYELEASVNGVTLPETAVLDVYEPDSPEGLALGCVPIDERPERPGTGSCLWVALLILLALVLVLVWWLRRRRGP